MATDARKILPVIDHGRSWLELRGLFVAVTAWDRDVPSSQDEMRLFVASQGEGRGLVTFKIVALVASVEIRCRRELPGMLIAVAVGAALELDFEQSIFALGNVALITLHPRMSSLQRIGRGRMVLHCELRRFPSIHGMTRGTLGAGRPLGELALVWVGFVAVHALLKSQRLFEIPTAVTLNAVDRDVLSEQRVFRL